MREWSILLLAGTLLLGGVLLSSAPASELTWSDVRPPRIEYISPPRTFMNVSMDVLIDGRAAPIITFQGRQYLAVPRLGTEYTIRVTNHGSRRITAIVAVDGRSVITGQPASELQPGYVVSPYGHVVIKGWRRDRDTVAAFTFEERERSYAARMGYPWNIGVISLVAFEEQDSRIRPLLELDRVPSGAKQAETGGTGTGYGRDIDSPVYRVPFIRSSNKRTITIHYDTVDALRRIGVPVDRYPPVPLPIEPDYCPPPPRMYSR